MIAAFAGLLCFAAGCSSTPPGLALPPAADLASQPELPDPLVALNGRVVTSPRQWRERRAELLRLFEHYVYGPIPPRPRDFAARMIGEHDDFLGGKATLRLVRLDCGAGAGPQIDLILVVPRSASSKPVPVFLAMNFCGNHALTDDPRVPLGRNWLGRCPGTQDGRATDACRGTQAKDWPLEEIVARGFALASFASADVDSDRGDVSDGLYRWLAKGDPAENRPADRGTLAAWAWGFHRCVDYLVADPDIDSKRIAAVGHSRNGKTALLAAAFDERIAIAFPHQAGCGGTAPSRGTLGESVKAINDRFPHWFNARFKEFNDAPERLPLDQHCLVALCAPRPVLISAAKEDEWSNPPGQYDVAKAATPVYELLGAEGVRGSRMPPTGRVVGGELAYVIRPGKHSMTAGDWGAFMNFADAHWR